MKTYAVLYKCNSCQNISLELLLSCPFCGTRRDV